ncbi:MAG: POT family MFS transporter [Deltaproteobacteria bacterium]|nr:POT family MFS transporter [Deltaproteobacteria bacterium]
MNLQTNSGAAEMPKGVPYIIGNEAAERFCYYGMRAILVVYMTQYLFNMQGQLAKVDPATAKAWYHLFSSAVYFTPLMGAVISDVFWGKYLTIIRLSLVYAVGCFVLALFGNTAGMFVGLTLIAIGSGGIKPVVSANVGDQFTKDNQHLMKKVFSIFYFAINFGSFFSTLLTPVLLKWYGPKVAFSVPGFLMILATLVFWVGRKRFTVVPPAGIRQYKDALLSPAGKKALIHLSGFFLIVSFFWMLFDQSSAAWILQAEKMDRVVDLRFFIFQYDWLHFELLASQTHAMNPVLVMILIPIFTYGIYPALQKFFNVTSLRKMTLGMFVAALSFVIIAMAEAHLQNGEVVGVIWQLWAYILLTCAEVMVSITALEFAYTQAPPNMKSIIMGLYLLSVTLGNLIAAGVNYFIKNPDGSEKLAGADYFWFFTILMVIAAVVFAISSKFYKEESYIQEDAGKAA